MESKLEHQGRQMAVEIRTSASPDDVWSAWADPGKISQWFCDGAEGWAHTGEQVTWIFDEFGYRLPYRVIESIPGESVIFGGQLPERPPFMLEITIKREGGETLVRLVNSGFLEGGSFDEEYAGVESGWTLALAMLKYYVEEHFGEKKQTVLVMRETNVNFAELLKWYTEPEYKKRWLTDFADRGILAATSKREVAHIWPDQNAFAEFKGWTAGDKKIIAMRITCWNPADGFMEGARAQASAALDRLAGALGS